MYYYGVLDQPAKARTPSLFDESNGRPTLNFVRLLQQYVRIIAGSEVLYAMNYYYTISKESIRYVVTEFS